MGGKHAGGTLGTGQGGSPRLFSMAQPASQARKDKAGLGRGSTQQKGHLWLMQPPSAPLSPPPPPARGIQEPERNEGESGCPGPSEKWAGSAPSSAATTLLPALPRPLLEAFWDSLEPSGLWSCSYSRRRLCLTPPPPMCPSMGKSLSLFMPQFPGL